MSPDKLIGEPQNVLDHGFVRLVDYMGSNLYTFDIPYVINMIIREMRAGMLLKLDPERVNARHAKISQ